MAFWKKSEKPQSHPREHGYLASTTYWLVLALSLVCILAHLVIGRTPTETASDQLVHVGHELLKEIGFAGVVAFLLIITIDGFSRKQHEKSAELLTDKVNKNLFEAVFKNKIPDELYKAVRSQLLESKVVRRDFDAIYTFSKLKDAADAAEWVRMEVIHTYRLENINSEDLKDFKITNTINIPHDPRLQQLCEVRSICFGDTVLSPKEIKEITVKDPENHFLRYAFEVDIPAGGSIKIQLRDKRIMRLHDSNVLCATFPTIGLSLTVNVPSGDLSLDAESLHAKDLEEKPLAEGGTMFQWQLPCGLLPYQGIYFQWRPEVPTKVAEATKVEPA